MLVKFYSPTVDHLIRKRTLTNRPKKVEFLAPKKGICTGLTSIYAGR